MHIFRGILLTIAISFPFYISPSEEKKIQLKNGTTIHGKIIEETESYIKIKTKGGVEGKLEKRFIENLNDVKSFPKIGSSMIPDNIKALEETFELPSNPNTENNPPDFPSHKDKILSLSPNYSEQEFKTELPKPQENLVINESKNEQSNQKLEFLLGAGWGKYALPGEEYTHRYQNSDAFRNFGSLGSSNPPKQKGDYFYSLTINYYWKKLGISLTRNSFNEQTYQTSALFADNIPSGEYSYITSGSYPSRQNITKADISYPIYSNSSIEFRLLAGQLESSSTSEDHTSKVLFFQSDSISYGKRNVEIKENLKGEIFGTKLNILFGRLWETRIETYALSLKGDRNYSELSYQPLVSSTGPIPFGGILNMYDEMKWKAYGFHFGLKLFYHFSNGLSLWIGINLFEWKYKLSSMLAKSSPIKSNWPNDLERQIIFNIIASQNIPISKSQSIELGLMKKFDF
ncbi:hypothetical protein V6Z05_17450 [Leptospira venezuelensis]|uniref:hypothetical protein n=1 Tax=Leptospira venezuelensis TaxID=1958811 RepID=UPI000A37E4E5|nr:hypothetical protein [Leptospira venezuelensis]